MASPTRWAWVWASSGCWWWTGKPGVLQFMGSQRVGHFWVTELGCWVQSWAFGKSKWPTEELVWAQGQEQGQRRDLIKGDWRCVCEGHSHWRWTTPLLQSRKSGLFLLGSDKSHSEGHSLRSSCLMVVGAVLWWWVNLHWTYLSRLAFLQAGVLQKSQTLVGTTSNLETHSLSPHHLPKTPYSFSFLFLPQVSESTSKIFWPTV